MATSKKIQTQIEAAEAELKEKENKIKELKQQHKTQAGNRRAGA